MVEARQGVLDAVAEDGDGYRIARLGSGQVMQQWNAAWLDDERILQHQITVVPIHEAEACDLGEGQSHQQQHEAERQFFRLRPRRKGAANIRSCRAHRIGHGRPLYHAALPRESDRLRVGSRRAIL